MPRKKKTPPRLNVNKALVELDAIARDTLRDPESPESCENYDRFMRELRGDLKNLVKITDEAVKLNRVTKKKVEPPARR
jgi:hypothetical protein